MILFFSSSGCLAFFSTRAFQSGLYPQPYNFPANTKKRGWKSTSMVLESSKWQSDWKAAEKGAVHPNKCFENTISKCVLKSGAARFIFASQDEFLLMSAMFSFH